MHIDPTHEELHTLRQQVPFAGQQVLEIGTGEGRLAWELAAATAQWVALDPDPVEIAARLPHPALPVQFVLGDARALPMPAAAFDVTFFSWSLC